MSRKFYGVRSEENGMVSDPTDLKKNTSWCRIWADAWGTTDRSMAKYLAIYLERFHNVSCMVVTFPADELPAYVS